MKQILITARLEISDHDGYCSGDECVYESKQINYICVLPFIYKDHNIGIITNFKDHDWIQYLPEIELNTNESYCCDLSNECEHAGLIKHDYKYTILNVEIVEIVEIID